MRRATIGLCLLLSIASKAAATPITWDWKFLMNDVPGDSFNTMPSNTPLRLLATFDPAANACSFGRGFFSVTGYAFFLGQRYDLTAGGIEVNNTLGNQCFDPNVAFAANQPSDFVFRLFLPISLPTDYVDPDTLIPLGPSIINFIAPFNGTTLSPALRSWALQSTLSMRPLNGVPFEIATGDTVSIDVVPEPSTWLLVGGGLAAGAAYRRRRMARAEAGLLS